MLVHLNGKLVPARDATVGVFDRGFVFGDGLYEGLRSVPDDRGPGARIVGLRRHVERLRAGLGAAGIAWDAAQLPSIALDVLQANNVRDAFVYFQITRGEPPPGAPVRTRIPPQGMRPTIFAYCVPLPPLDPAAAPAARTAVTMRDERWSRGRVKSISLMGNVIAAISAADRDADDAILLRDTPRGRVVSEGTATNVIAVLRRPDGDAEVVTPSLDSAPILAGVTRAILLDAEPRIVERALAADELRAADEIVMIGTTTLVAAIARLDDEPVGPAERRGEPGPWCRALHKTLCEAILQRRDDPPE